MQEFHLDQSFAGLNFHKPRQRFTNLRRIVAGVQKSLTRYLGAMHLPKTSSEIVEGPDRLIPNSLQDIADHGLRASTMNPRNLADNYARLRLFLRLVPKQYTKS
ncbi:hypothetical protein LBMAG52_09400 [Planctomycetia bacterium]|nr:hypothetical protein LBMAG52_09400 [Planctomycetia bacterium]